MISLLSNHQLAMTMDAYLGELTTNKAVRPGRMMRRIMRHLYIETQSYMKGQIIECRVGDSIT